MKFEIELDDLFDTNEYGRISAKTQRALQSTIIRKVAELVRAEVDVQIRDAVKAYIDSNLESIIAPKITKLCEDLLDYEYVPVTLYGSKAPPTTLRNTIIAQVQNDCVYKNDAYRQPQNTFTKVLTKIVTDQIDEFKSDFTKQVNEKLRQEAYAYAVKTLKEKLK